MYSSVIPVIHSLGTDPHINYPAFLVSARTQAGRLFAEYYKGGMNFFKIMHTPTQYTAWRNKQADMDNIPVVPPAYPDRPILNDDDDALRVAHYKVKRDMVKAFYDCLSLLSTAVENAVGRTIMYCIQAEHYGEIITLPMILLYLERKYSTVAQENHEDIRIN